ncbi:MAG: creatininase family protein [Anaerolineaceae bacterium]
MEDQSWMDVKKYLEVDDRLILILGACEQHGYLSLLTDSRIPQALADAASEKAGVLVAPALNFGISPYFLTYPGTISLRTSTLLDVAEDLVRSVYGYGFRRLLVLNGHGGNDAVTGRLVELSNELIGLQIAWYAWWESHSVGEIAIRNGIKPAHANWVEAFPFTRVGELPEGEKIPPSFQGLLDAEETREAYGDGVFGGKYKVEDGVMDEIFSACLKDILHLLDFEKIYK